MAEGAPASEQIRILIVEKLGAHTRLGAIVRANEPGVLSA